MKRRTGFALVMGVCMTVFAEAVFAEPPPATQPQHFLGATGPDFNRLFAATQPTRTALETFGRRKIFVGFGGLQEEIAVQRFADGGVAELSRGILQFDATLSAAAIEAFAKGLRDARIDTVPDRAFGGFDGVEYQLAHITPTSGRPLVINNPRGRHGLDADEPPLNADERAHLQIIKSFEDLIDSADWQVRVPDSWREQGIRPVYFDLRHPVANMIQDAQGAVWLSPDPAFQTDARWRRVIDPTAAVFKLETEETQERPAAVQDLASADASPTWHGLKIAAGRSAGEPDGTWFCFPQKPPERIVPETAEQAMRVGDDLLVARFDDDLRVLDLGTRKFRDVPRLARFVPVAVLDSHRVLIVRTERYVDNDRTRYEYRLLDPQTGKADEVQPDDRVWSQPIGRVDRLQRGNNDHEVWVAFGSPSNDEYPASTVVGRYDLKTFRFKSWRQLNSINFDTRHMRIDAARKRILALYDDIVVEIPLPDEDWQDRPE